MEVNVIVSIFPVLCNCWFVRHWLPLQSVDQLFGDFVMEELESGREMKRHNLRVRKISYVVPTNISSE